MKVMLLFFEEEDEEIFLKVQRLIQSAISTDEFHVSTHQFVSKTLEIQTDHVECSVKVEKFFSL